MGKSLKGLKILVSAVQVRLLALFQRLHLLKRKIIDSVSGLKLGLFPNSLATHKEAILESSNPHY